jgi:hypothetical protein
MATTHAIDNLTWSRQRWSTNLRRAWCVRGAVVPCRRCCGSIFRFSLSITPMLQVRTESLLSTFCRQSSVRHEFNSTKDGVPTHLGSVCTKCHQDVPPSLSGRKMTLWYGWSSLAPGRIGSSDRARRGRAVFVGPQSNIFVVPQARGKFWPVAVARFPRSSYTRRWDARSSGVLCMPTLKSTRRLQTTSRPWCPPCRSAGWFPCVEPIEGHCTRTAAPRISTTWSAATMAAVISRAGRAAAGRGKTSTWCSTAAGTGRRPAPARWCWWLVNDQTLCRSGRWQIVAL